MLPLPAQTRPQRGAALRDAQPRPHHRSFIPAARLAALLLLLLPAGLHAGVPAAPAGTTQPPATAPPAAETAQPNLGPGAAAGEVQPAPLLSPPTVSVPPERRITRQIAPGVRHVQVIREGGDAPLVMNLVRASLKQPGWQIQVRSGQERQVLSDGARGRTVVSRMAQGAIAGVNGDFFPGTGDPIGLQVVDGELTSDPYPNRSAFGITRDGRTLWGPVRLKGTVTIGNRTFALNGLNRTRNADELILFTPRYASTTHTNASGVEVWVEWLSGPICPGVEVTGTVSDTFPAVGSTAIPKEGIVLSGHGAAAQFLRGVSAGDGVSLRIDLVGEDGKSWNDVRQAVGGGPRLIKNGQVVRLAAGVEGFRTDVLNGRAPRTAVALSADGDLIFATVDGRQRWLSGGMTLAELAQCLRAEGAVEAMNLDGGGSTTLALRRIVANSPSEGTQRAVANALLIVPAAEAPADGGGAPATPGVLALGGVPPAPGNPAAGAPGAEGTAAKPPGSATDPSAGTPGTSAAVSGAALTQGAAGTPTAGVPNTTTDATAGTPAPQPEIVILPPVEGLALPDGAFPVPAGAHVQFRAARRLPDGSLQELPTDDVTWGFEGQTGVLGQDAAFLGTRAGSGNLVASTGTETARLKVATVPGPPVTLTAAVEVAIDGTAAVRVRGADAYENPAAGATATLSYATAEGAQQAQAVLDARGEARLALPLAALLPDAPASVAAGTAPTVALKLPKPPPPPAEPPPAVEEPAGR